MTEQDAREALRERLAEALCRTQAAMVGNLAPEAPCDYHRRHADALMPAFKEYAAEQVRWWEGNATYWHTAALEAYRWRDMNASRAEAAEAKVARVEALAEEMAEFSWPPAARHYASRIRAALDGSPAGSGGEEAGDET